MKYNYKRIVPNSISGLSLMLGVWAIYQAVAGDFTRSAIFIVLSVVADSLDGRAARALGVAGPFGVQLDSLCDLCAFGVAPAVLIYYYGLTPLGFLGQFVASLYTFLGAMRLARFNVMVGEIHGYFQGMPIPAGACFIATFVLSGMQFNPYIVLAGTFVIGCILYSEIRYPDFKGKGNPLYRGPVLLAALCGAALLYTNPNPRAWAFVGMFTYTLCGIINCLYVLLVRDKSAQ